MPILTPEGWVQPLDASGQPIPLDAEGHPIDESLTVEVDLGRLNVGRAPSQVLDRRADEVITLMNTATDLTVDAAGRLVFTVDGVTQTIDSPLENLAIYNALMTTGTIPGVADLPGTAFDFMVDGKLTAEDLVASRRSWQQPRTRPVLSPQMRLPISTHSWASIRRRSER